jgi:hypothetical protein
VHELPESLPTSTLALQIPVLDHEPLATSVSEYPVWCIIQHYCCITKIWWCTGTRDGEQIRFTGQCIEYIDPESLERWIHNLTTDSWVGYGSIIETIRHESLSRVLED